MQSVAFGVPVPPGKTAAIKSFVEELLSDKHDHFHTHRKGRGASRITVYHQMWPVEQFIVYMEATNLEKAMGVHDPSHEFESWFAKKWEELSGHHPDKITHEIAEVVMDWHPEKGGSRKHHG